MSHILYAVAYTGIFIYAEYADIDIDTEKDIDIDTDTDIEKVTEKEKEVVKDNDILTTSLFITTIKSG